MGWVSYVEIIALLIIAIGCFHIAIRCFSTKKSYDKMLEEEHETRGAGDDACIEEEYFEETEYSIKDINQF